jgi:GTP cyclohydrolase I
MSQEQYLGNVVRGRRFRFNDYTQHMPHLKFQYDADYYPEDADLPDPQIDPFIPGLRVQLDKVGVNGVHLPIKFLRRDGTVQELQAEASLYGSLDNPNAKGLNLSRFPIVMHEEIAGHLSIDGLKGVLNKLQAKQGSNSTYCKLRFKYPWTQEALRTRQDLKVEDFGSVEALKASPDFFKEVEGVYLSHKKAIGHIFYDCVLEAQSHSGVYTFFLTVNYVYSSTCPCSFELAQDATLKRGQAANGHSQRSIAKITVQFNPEKHIVYIEDIIEMARKQIPTEVVIICKRRDEQAFAELNGSNLLFTEDASRLMYQGLDAIYDEGKISDFSIVTEHLESLHPWSATAVVSKGIPGGLR